MEKKTYKRNNFINTYQLTEEEYNLLPLNFRMEYCYQKMGDLLARIREIGQRIIIDEEVDEYLIEFFKNNGCVVTIETSDADIKSTTITRVSPDFYPKSASDEVRLNQHIYNLATAKSKVFEDILKYRLKNQLKFLEVGIDLNLEGESPLELLDKISSRPISEIALEDSRDYLIYFQLKMLLDELEKSDVTIKKPSSHHLHYLKDFGYEVIEDESTITIKQKTASLDDKMQTKGFFKKLISEKGCKNN